MGYDIPEHCEQAFYVQDEKGNPIFKARVDHGGTIYFTTNSVGYCWARALQKGEEYTATAQKPGTHSGNPSVTYTACRSVIVFTLTSRHCSQQFKVQDENGNPIEGARVDHGGTIYYTTNSEGKCTFSALERGESYTATAKRSGYLDSNTKTYTACTSEIVFTLIRGASLTFRAQTPERVKLPNATVKIQEESQPTRKCTTDEYGECELTVSVPFTGTAIASHPSYRNSYPLNIIAEDYDAQFFFIRVLPMVCTQKFIVAAEDETPLPNAKVTMYNKTGGLIKTGTTDSTGICELSFTELYFTAKACCAGYECQEYDSIFECDPGSTILFYLPSKPSMNPQAQQIVLKNAEAMAEAVVTRYDGLTLPGFSDPPHTCPICGKSFNSTGEFMGHIGDHISAYEEQNKQWL